MVTAHVAAAGLAGARVGLQVLLGGPGMQQVADQHGLEVQTGLQGAALAVTVPAAAAAAVAAEPGCAASRALGDGESCRAGRPGTYGRVTYGYGLLRVSLGSGLKCQHGAGCQGSCCVAVHLCPCACHTCSVDRRGSIPQVQTVRVGLMQGFCVRGYVCGTNLETIAVCMGWQCWCRLCCSHKLGWAACARLLCGIDVQPYLSMLWLGSGRMVAVSGTFNCCCCVEVATRLAHVAGCVSRPVCLQAAQQQK
jgi:hypothetical protein